MIANARVARNKECCPTGFQLAPLPSFAVLIVDTRDNGVLRLDNRFDPLSNCVHLKKKRRRKRRKEGTEKKEGKEKKSKVRRYLACCFLLRSISTYKWAANRNAANRRTRFLPCWRKGRREKGGGEGIIANREKYEFAPGLLFSRRT